MTRVQETIGAIVALIVFALLLAGGVYLLRADAFEDGERAERAVWQERERQLLLDQDELRRIHAAEMRRAADIHQQVNEEVSTKYETAIDALRAGRAADIRDAERRGGLRISAGVCRDTSGTIALAEGTIRHHEETAGTIRLPQQVEADLWALAGDADEVTEQLRACQAWIVKQGFYGQPATN